MVNTTRWAIQLWPVQVSTCPPPEEPRCGGGGTSYSGLNVEALLKRGILLALSVYETPVKFTVLVAKIHLELKGIQCSAQPCPRLSLQGKGIRETLGMRLCSAKPEY